jgi:hypothetical protein
MKDDTQVTIRIRQVDSDLYEICKSDLTSLIDGVSLSATGEEMEKISRVVAYMVGIGPFKRYITPDLAIHIDTYANPLEFHALLWSPAKSGPAYMLTRKEAQQLYSSMCEVFGC